MGLFAVIINKKRGGAFLTPQKHFYFLLVDRTCENLKNVKGFLDFSSFLWAFPEDVDIFYKPVRCVNNFRPLNYPVLLFLKNRPFQG